MEFSIYFCNDGILRAKYSSDSPAIPISFIQQKSSFNDLKFWSKWWKNNVYFEDGLTVAKFLMCLEPWAEFWSDITNVDVLAYIKEVKKPILISDNNNEIDWIEISYYHEISPNVNYENMDIDDIAMWLNSPKNANLTGEWDIHSYYRTTGFKLNIEEQYSIDFTPLYKLANIPLILNNKQFIYLNDFYINKIIGKNKFLKPSSFGVCSKNNIKFLTGEKFHSLKDVVEGFFLFFDTNPHSRDDVIDIIQERLASIDIDKNSETINSLDTNKSNVVSIKDGKSLQENNSDKLTVKIDDNAFSSLINSFENNKHYWHSILDLAKNDNSVVLKIGDIQSHKSLENRVFGYIINDSDIEAKPIPSESKII